MTSRFRALPRVGKLIVTLEALATLIYATLVAKRMAYQQIAGLVSGTHRQLVKEADAKTVRRAIERVTWVVPGAACVPRALAANWMLARRGFASKIVVGVERNRLAAVSAHAWVVSGDLIVIGGTRRSLERFRVLMTLEGKTP